MVMPMRHLRYCRRFREIKSAETEYLARLQFLATSLPRTSRARPHNAGIPPIYYADNLAA